MDERQLLWLALPLLLGYILSYALEWILRPRIRVFWRRPFFTHVLQGGIYLALYGLILAIVERPWFALTITTALLFLVVMVNNAKYESLREPFTYQDFDYFTDAIRHPRLYLPFLGLTRGIAAILAFVLALYVGFTFERPLPESLGWMDFGEYVGAIFLLAAIFIWGGGRRKQELSYDPIVDMNALGFYGSIWFYAREEHGPCHIATPFAGLPVPAIDPPTLPNIVVVQSESFFRADRFYDQVRQNLFPEFTQIEREAIWAGKVQVPAWGANTVRTEFGFLSGLAESDIGVHRFNPYRKLALRGFTSLASHLQNLGYETICIHPYPASFYNRHNIYPQIGFSRFIDIREFSPGDKDGQYTGDIAIANKVRDIISSVIEKPLFIFCITMENHGPLHLESPRDGDEDLFYATGIPDSCRDLTVYMRHLMNADHMAGIIRDTLGRGPRGGIFAWYGDHVPIMPSVYRQMGTPESLTDGFIWRTQASADTCSIARSARITSMGVECLGAEIIRLLPSGRVADPEIRVSAASAGIP